MHNDVCHGGPIFLEVIRGDGIQNEPAMHYQAADVSLRPHEAAQFFALKLLVPPPGIKKFRLIHRIQDPAKEIARFCSCLPPVQPIGFSVSVLRLEVLRIQGLLSSPSAQIRAKFFQE